MAWIRKWTLKAPGSTADTVGYDDPSASLLIADGWGVAFSALEVRRVDASSGRVIGSVRTRTPIRAFGRATEGDVFQFVGNEKMFLHDAKTLARKAVHQQRFPRHCNAISDLGDGTVALSAPTALVEYDYRSGKIRRVSKTAPVALRRIDENVFCLTADGTVMGRAAEWKSMGCLPQPHFTGSIDERTGVVVALAGRRASAYDEDGSPQNVEWPRSRTVTMASLHGPWSARSFELPFPSQEIGIVRDAIVAVDTSPGWQTTLTSVAFEALDRPTVEHVPGRFVAFAGPYGLITSAKLQEPDAHELALFQRV